MARHDNPEAQAAWDDLRKLIMMCIDPDGWGIREKLINESLRYGKAMHDWGNAVGWNTGFDEGQGVIDEE